MAHSCPDCFMLCHCGGDIDDCCFDGTPEQDRCQHCLLPRRCKCGADCKYDCECDWPTNPDLFKPQDWEIP